MRRLKWVVLAAFALTGCTETINDSTDLDEGSGQSDGRVVDMGGADPDAASPIHDMGDPEPDMGDPEPDMGDPEPDMGAPGGNCDTACAHLIECATDEELALCDGIVAEATLVACEAACAERPALAQLANTIQGCAALIGAVADVDPAFAEACHGDVEPPLPEDRCAPVCARVAGCAADCTEDSALVEAHCLGLCAQTPGAAELIDRQDDCDNILDLLRAADDQFAALCPPEDPVDPPEAPCALACVRVAECATDGSCRGVDEGSRALIAGICGDLCAANAALAPLVLAQDACPGVLAVAADVAPEFAALCEPEEEDARPRCERACDRISTCAIDDVCPGVGPEDAPIVSALCAPACTENPFIADLVLAQPDCESLIELAINADPNIAALCAVDQPPADQCAVGCARLAECATEPEANRCAALGPAEHGLIEAGCMPLCEETPDLVDPEATCEELLETARAVEPVFADLCPPAPPGMGDPCQDVCARLAGCASPERGLCGPNPLLDPNTFINLCVPLCEANPALPAVAAAQPSCEDLVAVARQTSPEFAGVCPGDAPPPPPNEGCEAICDHVLQCATDPNEALCPNFGPEDERRLSALCQEQCVAFGDIAPGILPQACAPLIELLSTFSADFADLCGAGDDPVEPPAEGCAMVCERASACAFDAEDGICNNRGDAAEADFTENCQTACAMFAPLLDILNGQDTCEGLVGAIDELTPDFAALCGN